MMIRILVTAVLLLLPPRPSALPSQTRPVAPRLEFRIAEEEPLPGTEKTIFVIPGDSFLPPRPTDRSHTETLYLRTEVIVDNAHVSSASVRPDDRPGHGGFQVWLRFTAEGTSRMKSATIAHKFKRLAVILDGSVLMAPKLQSEITDQAVITTSTRAQAERVASVVPSNP